MTKKNQNSNSKFWRLFSSIVLALLVWYSVNGTTNNILTRYITNVPVTLVNSEVLTEKGLSYDKNQTYFVNLEVRGTESSLNALDPSEITAEVDLSQIESAGTESLDVVIKGLNNTVILDETIPGKISINIDESAEMLYTPRIIAEGKPADGLSVISINTDTEVSVYGDSNEIKKVDRVSGTVLVDGMSHDSFQYIQVYAYDQEGDLLENVTCDPDFVEVEIILGVTKEVPINPPAVEGTPEQGYKIEDIRVNPSNVIIAGKKEIVDTIESINVEPIMIPEGSKNKSFSTESTLIMPDGIETLNQSYSVNVSVEIEQEIERTYTITNLEPINLADDLEVIRISPGSVAAKIKGTATELSAIDASQLKGYIDLNGLTEGSYTQPIVVTLEGVTLVSLSPETVQVEIRKK